MKLLIANRGEIALRIARAAAELELPSVAIYSEDDARSRHALEADESAPLRGSGVRAYLDAAQIPRHRARARLRRDPSRVRIPREERGVRARLR